MSDGTGFDKLIVTSTASAGTVPVLVEIIRTDFRGQNGIRSKLSCKATGTPLPEIRWEARNSNTRNVRTVSNSDPGIEISTPQAINQSFISSEITIFQNSMFRMPRCIASNENGVDRMMSGEVVTVIFSPTTTEAGRYELYIDESAKQWNSNG